MQVLHRDLKKTQPSTLHPQSSTLNPPPSTLNPQPSTQMQVVHRDLKPANILLMHDMTAKVVCVCMCEGEIVRACVRAGPSVLL